MVVCVGAGRALCRGSCRAVEAAVWVDGSGADLSEVCFDLSSLGVLEGAGAASSLGTSTFEISSPSSASIAMVCRRPHPCFHPAR